MSCSVDHVSLFKTMDYLLEVPQGILGRHSQHLVVKYSPGSPVSICLSSPSYGVVLERPPEGWRRWEDSVGFCCFVSSLLCNWQANEDSVSVLSWRQRHRFERTDQLLEMSSYDLL